MPYDLERWLPRFPTTPFMLEADNVILLGRRGSEAHGLYIPPTDPNSVDDRDLMGIVIPPWPYYMGLRSWEGAESMKEDQSDPSVMWDVVFYEYRKFVMLLANQNPNVLGMLWLEPEDYLKLNEHGRLLIDNRDVFRAAKPAYKSFTGYAIAQLKKMTTGAHRGYMGAKRKALVEKYGYDTKNAAHLVRLLHMGEEYLRTGVLHVRRTHDRDQLLAIKRGEWSLVDVQKYAADCQKKCDDAFAHTVLPEAVDMARVEELVLYTFGEVFIPYVRR